MTTSDIRRVIVVGASRGIGRALAEAFQRHGTAVVATVRTPPDEHGVIDDVTVVTLDMADLDAGRTLEACIAPGTSDAIIVSAGVFGPTHQDVAQAGRDDVADLFWTNAVSPIRLARRLLPLVRTGGVIAFLSSRTASITLNTQGDMELYRASKTALNALARSFAVKNALPAGIGVLLLHPGWVQTEMGGSEAPVTVDDSVAGLHAVITGAMDQPAFRFIDYQGRELMY